MEWSHGEWSGEDGGRIDWRGVSGVDWSGLVWIGVEWRGALSGM